MENNDPIYLVDGYGVIFKSYFAMVRSPLSNNNGENVSAILGFVNTIQALLKAMEGRNLAVILDSKGPTFRHERYPEYKANRNETPEELIRQIIWLDELLESWGLPFFRASTYEADDLIATVASRASQQGRECYIISSDKDLLQLVDEHVKVLKSDKGKFISLGVADVGEAWGVSPDQIRDYLAIVGDAADNIPGVKGIGKVGATKLLQEYHSLENIYRNLVSIKPDGMRKKLEEGRAMAELSYELVGLAYDAPISEDWADYHFPLKETYPELSGFLREIGLERLARSFAVPAKTGGQAQQVREKEPAADEEGKEEAFPKAASKEAKAGDGAVELPKTNVEYECVRTLEQLERWCAQIKNAKYIAMDCETTGLDELQDRLLGVSIALGEGLACYIPVETDELLEGSVLGADVLRSKLQEALDSGCGLIGQNFKFDYKVLSTWGLRIENIYFDTMIAAWLLDSLHPVGMDALAARYLGLSTIQFKEIVPKGQTFASVELGIATQYAAEDADITWRLYEKLAPMLEAEGLSQLFFGLEMPLVKILGDMELNGIPCNQGELEAYGSELGSKVADLQAKVMTIAGEDFNLNSTQQLASILFERLGLPSGKKTKQGYSTNSTTLEGLRQLHPIIEPILEYRRLNKLLNTYVQPLPGYINPSTQRVHTHFSPIGAETGRLNSRDPNLQNIPIKDEEGRKIRSAFQAKAPYKFLSADYSQIELVVLAHLSEDRGLCEAFRSGRDIHQQTASTLFFVDAAKVTADQRRIAKSINFGVIYGMSAFRLAQDLGLARQDAKNFIAAYFREFSGVKNFIQQTVASAEKSGVVQTLAGRRREIPQLRSQNKVERSHGERMAVNTVVQGSAADIVKSAMIHLAGEFQQRKLQSRMLLQVHDEMIFEVHPDEKANLQLLVPDVMENAYELEVPLKVNIEMGESWGAVH